MAQQFTVAEGAALINVVIVVLTLSFPLLVAVVAVGILKKDTNAATWSVFGRLINQSLWPNLLGTDTAGTTKVDKRIKGMTALSTSATLILAVAAAFTPLGLYDITYLEQSKSTVFSYVRDTSPIGRATPSRSAYSMNRYCGIQMSCPGNDDPYTFSYNRSGVFVEADLDRKHRSLSTKIAPNITEVFGSATGNRNTTVAGVFDIQYRFYENYNNDINLSNNNSGWIDHGRPRTQGQFKFYQDFVVDSRVQAVEGLIVSTTDSPGIGFRNHTLPPASELGYTWSEEILWLEPETSCTNLNITYDFTVQSPYLYTRQPKGVLVDRGGFVNVVEKYPFLDLNNTQDSPQLLARSYKAAVLTNWLLLDFFGEKKNASYIGKEYNINEYLALSLDDPLDPLQIAFGQFAYEFYSSKDPTRTQVYLRLPKPLDAIIKPYSLNKNLDTEYWIDNDVQSDANAITNISTAGTGGGLLLGTGAPLDTDGNIGHLEYARAVPGTKWSRPLYSCISAIKASVKVVEFQTKGDTSLANLNVKSVEPVDYSSSASSPPTWAMENTRLPLEDLSPFWGIVSSEKSSLPDISTLSRPEFYIPAGASSAIGIGLPATDAAAGADAPFAAFSSIYTGNVGEIDQAPVYLRGINDWSMLTKWANLGAHADTAGRIADYLWVDLLANNLVSSKNAMANPHSSESATWALMPARQYRHSIGYDWRFAIAALVFAALYIFLFAWTTILLCTKQPSLSTIRFMLNQSAAGRSMTTERHQASGVADYAQTKEWAKERGGDMMRLTKGDAEGLKSIASYYCQLDSHSKAHKAVPAGPG